MKTHILVQPYMRGIGEDVKNPGSDPQRYQDLLENLTTQMKFADDNGYYGFCMTEHHLQVEGIETTTNPILWNMHVANNTKHLKVGQVGMCLPAHNPVTLAEDLAMLDHMTKGRLYVGFVRGNTPRWLNTLAQHLNISTSQSDKSEVDQRNRRLFEENYRIIKKLWTEDTINFQGEFWNIPPKDPIEWHFPPTKLWSREGDTDENNIIQRVGIVPKPYQDPHPPIYAPFSWSMDTCRFWAREGGKMVSFVGKNDFIDVTIDEYVKEAETVGRKVARNDVLALGGHLVIGRTEAESKKHKATFENLFNTAYNVPPYKVPMGRLWEGSIQQVIDQVGTLKEKYGVDEFVCWHHVGYFPQEEELAMLEAFGEVIKALK
ncbi:MAG: LLM class flavin-dependent oxidoreductase [Endozoicomonas sp.]